MSHPPASATLAAPIGPGATTARVLPTRKARWPTWLLALMACGLVLLLAIVTIAGTLEFAIPMSVSVDGEDLIRGIDLGSMPPAHKVVLAAVILVALLAALIVVPVAMILGVVALLALGLLVIGLPVLAVLLAVALLLAPLLLPIWLLWKALA